MSARALASADETVDRLTRRLEVIQKRHGHRAATDDTLLAWAAARARPRARRVLDLGTGKGTVAMLLVERLPDCVVVGVEAVAESFDLAVRNARANDIAARFSPRLGDLRDEGLLAAEAPFDLVVGAPPFVRVGAGVMPKDKTRAAGRFELRGGVEDYVAAARRHLAPDGQVVILMDGREESRERTAGALQAADLALCSVLAVAPREGRPSTYRIFVAARDASRSVEGRKLVLRQMGDGGFTSEYQAIRVEMDLA